MLKTYKQKSGKYSQLGYETLYRDQLWKVERLREIYLMAQWSSRRMSGLGPNSKLQQIQVPAVVSRIRRYNSLLSLSIPEHRTCLLINLHDNTAKSWWSGQSKNKTTVFRRACQVLPTGQETTLILFSWTRYCYNLQKIFIVTLFFSYFVTFSKLFVLFSLLLYC